MPWNGLPKIRRRPRPDYGSLDGLCAREGSQPLSSRQTAPPTFKPILTVIGRRKTTGKNRGNARLNLSKTQLADAILPNANLSQVDLIQAHLRSANLTGADLREADLTEADLHEADLDEADLHEAENLTAKQVRSAKNWHKATLPDYLQYLLTEQPAPPA